MGLFGDLGLGDIAMGYMSRQRELNDKEAEESYQQNKSSIGNLSKFWTAAFEGARQDPEVQQALLGRIAEINQLDPRKKNVGKDIARLGDASLLWQGVKRSPESMQPKMDTMQAEVNAPSIPLPKPPGMDGGAPMASGLTSGAQMPPVQLESNIPLPAPPTEYMSVYPSEQEIGMKQYAAEEVKAQNALKRELEKQRALKQLNQEFAQEDPTVQNDFTLSPGQARYRPGESTPYASVAAAQSTTAERNQQFRDIERSGRTIRRYFEGNDPSKVTFEEDMGPVHQPVFQQQLAAGRVDAGVPTQFQNAIDSATIKIPTNKIPQIVDNVERRLKSGDVIGAKQYLRLAALRNEPVDVQNKVTGRREATRHMEDIGEILKTVPTGMLQGTVEQTANYLGKTTDPKLKALASRLVASMQSYRRSITGAAFNAGETTEYSQFWPGFKSDLPTNQAMIKGLTDKFNADDDTYWFNVFHEPGWSDTDVNPRRGGGLTPPNPPGGSTGGGATAVPSGNRTRIKVQP